MSIVILFFFLVQTVTPARAELVLPPAGQMVGLSQVYNPPVLKGLKVYPQEPLRFDFILDKGDDKASTDEQIKTDSTRLIKYFLASLTIPEKDLWVNLSPYEKDRIIPEAFGQTEMGRDLLAQDYLLKQIMASLLYPEGETGKQFWQKVYALAHEKYGTTDIPVDTFNKVWIVPEKAVVYENGKAGAAYVTESRLKVMLESDYLAQEKNAVAQTGNESNEIAKEVMRAVVIPELEREVNEGKNFAKLRQVYQSLILATWYKNKIKQSLLSAVYVDRKKTDGVNIADPKEAEKIWGQYVEAFKKGTYNFVKEERDEFTDDVLPRKYFSGGWSGEMELGFEREKPYITEDSDFAELKVDLNAFSSINRVFVDATQTEAGRVLSEFTIRFGKQADLMLGLFGETLLKEPPLRAYFDKLITHFKLPLTSQSAVYLASLLRVEAEGFNTKPYSFRYRDPESENFMETAYAELDDEFIEWVVKAEIPVADFPNAYGLYVGIKNKFKPVGNRNKFHMGSKQKINLLNKLRELNPLFRSRPLFTYRGGNVLVDDEKQLSIRNIKKEKGFSDNTVVDIQDLSLGYRTDVDGRMSVYLYSNSKLLGNSIIEEFGGNPGPRIFLVYAEISIDQDGQPIILALQPQINVPRNENPALREYVENAVTVLLFILEHQIFDLFPSNPGIYQLKMATAAFHLMNQRMAERTAWTFYADLPVKAGFHVVAADGEDSSFQLLFAKTVVDSDQFMSNQTKDSAQSWTIVGELPGVSQIVSEMVSDRLSRTGPVVFQDESGKQYPMRLQWAYQGRDFDSERVLLELIHNGRKIFECVYHFDYTNKKISSIKLGDIKLLQVDLKGLYRRLFQIFTAAVDVVRADIVNIPTDIAIKLGTKFETSSNPISFATSLFNLTFIARARGGMQEWVTIRNGADQSLFESYRLSSFVDDFSTDLREAFAEALQAEKAWIVLGEFSATGLLRDRMEKEASFFNLRLDDIFSARLSYSQDKVLELADRFHVLKERVEAGMWKDRKRAELLGALVAALEQQSNRLYAIVEKIDRSQFDERIHGQSDSFGGRKDKLNAKGGIDFNSSKLELKNQNAGGEINFHIDPAMLQKMQNATGFSPVIIAIQPISSLNGFLGLADRPAVGIKPG